MSSILRADESPSRYWRLPFIDEICGSAAALLALLGLSGVNGPLMAVTATIAFGAAWIVDGRAILSHNAQGARRLRIVEHSAQFVAGAGGTVLGVLALLGFASALLTPIAEIVYGAALILKSAERIKFPGPRDDEEPPFQESERRDIQAVTGIIVVILGVLAADGNANDLSLNLIALLALGAGSLATGGVPAATGALRRRRQKNEINVSGV